MYIDSQFPPLYVFYNAIGTLRIFSGAKHDRHVVVACSFVENCPLYSGFRGRVARIARCNIELMPPENRTDTIGRHWCALRNKFRVGETCHYLLSFSSLISGCFLFFRVNIALI